MASLLERLLPRLRARPSDAVTETNIPVSPLRDVLADNPGPATAGGCLDRQGLFVIGAARTGTTILQNALNDSADVFLLGEPAFHHDPGTADFAERYNARHRAWHNQENKSSHCPRFFDGDDSWHAYLHHLARLYRRVGSKIVVNPEDADAEVAKIFDFHSRHFYRSHHLFTFRHPLDVLVSVRTLAAWSNHEGADHASILRSFHLVVQLYLRMLRNLPHVSAVFHEGIDAQTFQALGRALGVDLHGAAAYYDRGKVHRHTLDELPAAWHEPMRQAVSVYEDLRREVEAGPALLQVEQNSHNLDERHYTVLGRLWRRTELLLAALDGTP